MVKMIIVFDTRHGGPKETIELRISNRDAEQLMDARKKVGVDSSVRIGIELHNDNRPKGTGKRR